MLNSVFVDTSFIIALINEKDNNHLQALKVADVFENSNLVITDGVLLEIGNALSKNFRAESVEIIRYFLISKEAIVVNLNPVLFNKAFSFYETHDDKSYGLVDCVSFVVMMEMAINRVLTFDKHFAQAGFVIVAA
jgi:hypothetical protein